MEPKSSAVDPYPELISMHGSIILPSFMLLTKSARFGPKWCLSCPTKSMRELIVGSYVRGGGGGGGGGGEGGK